MVSLFLSVFWMLFLFDGYCSFMMVVGFPYAFFADDLYLVVIIPPNWWILVGLPWLLVSSWMLV